MSRKSEGTVHSKMLNIRGNLQAIEAIEATDARIAQVNRHSSAMRKVPDPISDNVAGEVVLPGRFTPPVAAKAGDVIDADYGPLGRFEFKFT